MQPLSAPSKRREDSERSIFVRLKDGGYRLRDNTLFHLYVSTSPCGDARLNSPYEITTDRKRWHFYVFGSPMLCWVPHCLCPDPACVVCGVWRVACGVWRVACGVARP